MRQKRAKAYRKLMQAYSLAFGFRQPYQVLVDSLMCKEAIDHKSDLVKQLGVVLQGTVKPMITQCCIHELYLQGKAVQAAVDLAKTFERRKCNHKEAILGDDCVASVVGDTNKHRYVVATQSQPLRSKLRKIPAVPVVHINRSVMILEPMSETTAEAKEKAEQAQMLPSAAEAAKVAQGKPAEEPPRKKRKGPKGPNPLSVKKKKVQQPSGPVSKPAVSEGADQTSAKRKRADDGHPDPANPEGPEKSGHKRKRRRKGAPKPAGGSVDGNNASDNED
ncbi:PIN domain-like protein [Phanerochaete sordida]|uniref:U three protein 23 n=1 Tax=Phanerochaete sordida TaxID=48140 RepID=A0A9P3G174_9APHY|nr:PIN domain-like protein [Phanerochaete sordida]